MVISPFLCILESSVTCLYIFTKIASRNNFFTPQGHKTIPFFSLIMTKIPKNPWLTGSLSLRYAFSAGRQNEPKGLRSRDQGDRRRSLRPHREGGRHRLRAGRLDPQCDAGDRRPARCRRER